MCIDIIIHDILDNKKLTATIEQKKTDAHYEYINPIIYNLLSHCDTVYVKCSHKIIELLPDSIQNIYIDIACYYETHNITKYPKNLIKLVVNTNLDWEKNINKLPDNIQHLEFNCRIMNNNISISNLPVSLTYLKIGKLRQNIIFPPMLKYLELLTFSNDDIDNLPSSLETLKLTLSLNHYQVYETLSSSLNCLPDNIQKLSLDIKINSYNKEEIIKVNKSIRIQKLPQNLEYLQLRCDPKYFEICKELPNSLNTIKIDSHIIYDGYLISDFETIFRSIKPDINISIANK